MSVTHIFRERFRLTTATIATATSKDGKPTALQIPAGSLIVVLDGAGLNLNAPNQQVCVEWQGRTVTMFGIDIRERGERVQTA